MLWHYSLKTHFFERMKKQVLALRLSLNLVEDERKVLGQVAETDVAESVRRGRLDLLAAVVEAVQNGLLQAGVLAQITKTKQIGVMPRVSLVKDFFIPRTYTTIGHRWQG